MVSDSWGKEFRDWSLQQAAEDLERHRAIEAGEIPRPPPRKPIVYRRGPIDIGAELDFLHALFANARIRPSYVGSTWQVWPNVPDGETLGSTQLSIPVGEPGNDPDRTRARAEFVAGKTGRFQLDDFETDAGIPAEMWRGRCK